MPGVVRYPWAVVGRLSVLRDEQPHRGTLAVVRCRRWARCAVGKCAVPRHRGHRQSMWQSHSTDGDRCPQLGRHGQLLSRHVSDCICAPERQHRFCFFARILAPRFWKVLFSSPPSGRCGAAPRTDAPRASTRNDTEKCRKSNAHAKWVIPLCVRLALHFHDRRLADGDMHARKPTCPRRYAPLGIRRAKFKQPSSTANRSPLGSPPGDVWWQ
jgi:hypothetical protein